MLRLPTTFAPHLTSPLGGEVFNSGIVSITWDISNPPSTDRVLINDGEKTSDNWTIGNKWSHTSFVIDGITYNGFYFDSENTTITSSVIEIEGSLTVGKTYDIIYSVVFGGFSDIRVIAGTTSGTVRQANSGTYSENLICNENGKLSFEANGVSPFTCTLQLYNIIVREIQQSELSGFISDEDPYDSVVTSYEIEYTENYKEDTDWHTLKRRIPWIDSSYDWVVGKMIKSDSVRIRIRAKNVSNGVNSDWSMSGSNFSVNVFKLIPPAIVSPVSNQVYTDFILIILDESLTKNTFNQKVRYTLEYSSEKRGIDWTIIAKNIPVGQNVIRWDLDEISPSDDYILRLTTKNSAVSCLQSSELTPDQIAKRFIYNLKIQQPGMFIIDTKPPEVILDIEGSDGVTNELSHVLTVFAEDETTNVEQIQLRECEATNQAALGNVSSENLGTTQCTPIEELLNVDDVNFDKLIGKPMGYSTKIQWTLDDASGLRRIEALLTDSGGNISIQASPKSFIPIFRHSNTINDMIVTVEDRQETVITEDANGNIVTTTSVGTFESAYAVTDNGEYWIIDPFPRRIYKNLVGRDIIKLFAYGSSIYQFAYTNTIDIPDFGAVYRDSKTFISRLFVFPNPLSITTAVATFQDVMYIGLENGELWSFESVSFVLVNTFDSPISAMAGDDSYLYIGLSNSSLFFLYNGTEFFTSDVES